jgi:hypothetical protein
VSVVDLQPHETPPPLPFESMFGIQGTPMDMSESQDESEVDGYSKDGDAADVTAASEHSSISAGQVSSAGEMDINSPSMVAPAETCKDDSVAAASDVNAGKEAIHIAGEKGLGEPEAGGQVDSQAVVQPVWLPPEAHEGPEGSTPIFSGPALHSPTHMGNAGGAHGEQGITLPQLAAAVRTPGMFTGVSSFLRCDRITIR